VDAHGVPLQDWSLPNRGQYYARLGITNSLDEVLDEFHVLTTWKDRAELLFCRLKDAERRVVRSVDDLDVSHAHIVAGRAKVRNGSKSGVGFAPSTGHSIIAGRSKR